LSPDAVAKLLGVSDQTVVNLCREGKLKHIRVGRQYRIYKDVIEQMIGRPIEGGEEHQQ